MEEFGFIVLIASLVVMTWTGHHVGYDTGYKEGNTSGYKHGIEDGKRLQRQEEERAMAFMRTQYGEDIKFYDKKRA